MKHQLILFYIFLISQALQASFNSIIKRKDPINRKKIYNQRREIKVEQEELFLNHEDVDAIGIPTKDFLKELMEREFFGSASQQILGQDVLKKGSVEIEDESGGFFTDKMYAVKIVPDNGNSVFHKSKYVAFLKVSGKLKSADNLVKLQESIVGRYQYAAARLKIAKKDLPQMSWLEKIFVIHSSKGERKKTVIIEMTHGAQGKRGDKIVQDLNSAQLKKERDGNSITVKQELSDAQALNDHYAAQLGKSLATLQLCFLKRRKSVNPADWVTLNHMDLHGENVFFDLDKNLITFIDNETMELDKNVLIDIYRYLSKPNAPSYSQSFLENFIESYLQTYQKYLPVESGVQWLQVYLALVMLPTGLNPRYKIYFEKLLLNSGINALKIRDFYDQYIYGVYIPVRNYKTPASDFIYFCISNYCFRLAAKVIDELSQSGVNIDLNKKHSPYDYTYLMILASFLSMNNDYKRHGNGGIDEEDGIKLAKQLLLLGADPTVTTTQGKTALDFYSPLDQVVDEVKKIKSQQQAKVDNAVTVHPPKIIPKQSAQPASGVLPNSQQTSSSSTAVSGTSHVIQPTGGTTSSYATHLQQSTSVREALTLASLLERQSNMVLLVSHARQVRALPVLDALKLANKL